MSHEIRTPMNAVIGTVQLLQKTELGDRQHKLLDTITFGSKTLMAIISDILDLSKVEANRLQLESIPFRKHDDHTIYQMCQTDLVQNLDSSRRHPGANKDSSRSLPPQ